MLSCSSACIIPSKRLDDNHYDHGYVFTASKKWIEMEQRRFKAEFPQNRKYKTKQKDRAEQPVKQTVVAQTAAGKRGRSVAERKSLASVQSHGASAPVHRFSRSASPYRLIHASASILASPTEKSRLLSSAHNSNDHVHPENLKRESKLPSRDMHQTGASAAFFTDFDKVSWAPESVPVPISTQCSVEKQNSRQPLFLPASDVSDDESSTEADHVNARNNPSSIPDDNTMHLRTWQDALLSYVAKPHQLDSAEGDHLYALLQEMITNSDFSRLSLWIISEVKVTILMENGEVATEMKNKGQILRMLARMYPGKVASMVKRLLEIWGRNLPGRAKKGRLMG
ncbi:hypothetical protein B0H10DRAFT_2119868 [Mycena sp. CBHHK59/15]|nr:hypothetical protein B0H10DRAFT_2119868 [Mycena sp. CBHHK59/15]